jgi:hypothetical protein
MKKLTLTITAFLFSTTFLSATAQTNNTTDEGVIINGTKWTTRNLDVTVPSAGARNYSGTVTNVGINHDEVITISGSNGASTTVNVICTVTNPQDIIIEYDPENSILIYPNPTFGELTIQDSRFKIQDVEIFDVVGKCHALRLSRVTNNETTIDISHLLAGVYFVRIETNGGMTTKKVIKN